MFRDERILLIDLSKDRGFKLEVGEKIVALIFIKGDKLIIKGDVEVMETNIVPPEIKSI